MSEWKEVRFLDVVHLNPRISLEKGVEYPFVEMSNVVPCARKPEKDVFKKYLGEGTKFEQGDTIVARIEPCLQNGKGFQCSYKQGFGSTEFLVFRPVNINDLDCDFLYYYMGQQSIREAMAKTMVGASGRQRVNNKVFNDLQINLPPLQTQHRIATILSRYDSLIENYQKQIKLLEEAAQRLYKEWFVDLHFPGHENTNIVDGVPEGWEKKSITDVLEIKYGKDHKLLKEGTIPVYGTGGIMRYVEKSLFTGESVLIPRKGSLNNIMLVGGTFWTIDTMFYSIPKENNVAKIVYFYLKGVDMYSFNIGAAVPSMTVNILSGMKLLVPNEDVKNKFETIVSKYFIRIHSLQSQLRLLTEARDRLLPKLMSGEITV